MTTQRNTKLGAAVVALAVAQAAANATEIADATGSAHHALQVTAAPATVTIAPGSARRQSIILPALEYVFSLNARCADSFAPETVALTIADSRTFLRSAELAGDSARHEMPLTVPADQLAPLIVGDFCPATGDAAMAQRTADNSAVLTVSATLTATASLLCVADNRREMIYTTTPLDIMLVCEPAETAATED